LFHFKNLIVLPDSFIKQIHADFPHLADRILNAYAEEAPTSIRLNPTKSGNLAPLPFQQVSWEALGFYMESRPLFTADPLFHSGVYYVQEASSMFIGAFLRELIQNEISVQRVLDLSAAPGGKTTHFASILPSESLLVANEINRNRSLTLRENLAKWGNSNVVATNNEASDFARLPHFFDLILVDAPCSGEGMFRKDPDSISEWSTENVTMCASRQDEILRSIWPTLKPGGLLIYSTCTLNKNENEFLLAEFVESSGAEWIAFEKAHEFPLQTLGNIPYYRCLPGVIKGEGFSFGCIRKPMHSRNETFGFVSPKTRKNILKPILPSHKGYVQHLSPKAVEWFQFGESYLALPFIHAADIHLLSHQLSIVKAGTIAGELKGNELRPHQEWCLSDLYQEGSYPQVELNYDQAIAYLRRDELWLDTGLKKGYFLFTYFGIPLGFAKIAGNRINNLYPMDWRIRMQIAENKKFSLANS
jgi:16S rRNA C967 or C1407 C5-methylase (RsmB/RsmF family)/NOL1/NOP2/fmu family ribosome biogenesis protein